MEYQQIQYGDLTVYYTSEIAGGGQLYGQDYRRLVREEIGPVKRLFEWCAGPGFIGFSLLEAGLCETLCLADVNPQAAEACRETVARNGLADRVDVYLSDNLDAIPDSEKWDLVVGNPPHASTDQSPPWGPDVIYRDVDWAVHRRFYEQVGRHLAPGADVLIQENARVSELGSFSAMIEENGLETVCTLPCAVNPEIYYIWVRAASGTPVSS